MTDAPSSPPPPPAQAVPPSVPVPPVAGYGVPAAVPSAPTSGALPAGVSVADPWIRLGSYFLESLLILVTLGIGWIIWAATTAGSGQTPAKKLLNLRVISADTYSPVGMGKMFWVRGLIAGFVVYWATVFTLGIILFMPFWDKRNQNLWDKVSTTYVVTDPTDAWQTKPDLRS